MQRNAYDRVTDGPKQNRAQRVIAYVATFGLLVGGVSAYGLMRSPGNQPVPIDPMLVSYVATPVPLWTPAPTTSSTSSSTTSTTTAPPSTTTTAAPTTTMTAPTRTGAPIALTTTTVIFAMDGNQGEFALPPGSKLPTEAQCTKRVHKTKEAVAGNAEANNAVPTQPLVFGNTWGSNPQANTNLKRVTGHFTGTTDEIIQWAACKWGLDVDAARAQIMVESSWRQSATAGNSDDQTKCMPDMVLPCPTAFGLFQLRTDYQPGTYPWSATSTAFNADYALAMKRTCYDGALYLGPQTRGDAWGCVGVHYSGHWKDQPALTYIEKVKTKYATKTWPKTK